MTTPPIVAPAIAPTGNVVFVVAEDAKEVLVGVASIDKVDTGPVVSIGENVGWGSGIAVVEVACLDELAVVTSTATTCGVGGPEVDET